MNNEIVRVPGNPISVRPTDTDDQLLELWLHGRSPHTQRAYRADAKRLHLRTGKRLHQITLSDLQAFADDLELQQLAAATRHRRLAAIKSLFTFAHRLGYLPFDVARPLRLPPIKDTLAQRLLDESDVQRLTDCDCHLLVCVADAEEPKFRAVIERHGYEFCGRLIWYFGPVHGVRDARNDGFLQEHLSILCYRRGKAAIQSSISSVIHCPRELGRTNTQEKPLALLKRLIEVTTAPGDLVCAPFCTTGQTETAAGELGRRFVTLDPAGI